jgi:DNA polymerase-3 subunit alpha
MWPDDFARHKSAIVEDHVCFVKAVVERSREEPGLIVSRILMPEQAQVELARGLWLLLSLGTHGAETVEAVARLLRRSPGSCPVYLSIRDGAGKRTDLKLGEGFHVNPAGVAAAEIEALLGTGSVKFAGPTNGKRY